MGNLIIKDEKCMHYYKDQWNVYYQGQKVPQATAMTFEDLGHGYGKDMFDVFYKGKRIMGANPPTFVVDNEYDSHDVFNRYWKGKIVNYT
jgi:hypothetical protein